jgi:hypothetical protein
MKLQRGRLAKSFRRFLRSSQIDSRKGQFRCSLESLESRTLLAADLGQNPVNYLDVNHDGMVSALDALVIINDLNANGSHTSTGPLSSTGLTALSLSSSTTASASSSTSGNYLDVNGDGMVTPLDALLIANVLNSPGPSVIAQLVAIDASGAVISTSGSTQNTLTLNQGQDFSLVLRITDVRTTSDANNNFGVFAAYTDVAITNSNLASLGSLLQHGTDYPSGPSGSITTSFIDAAGGISGSLTHLDKAAHLLWSTSVHTIGAGTLTFSPDYDRVTNGNSGSGVVSGHEFLLYGENTGVTGATDVLFKPLVVTINAAVPPTLPTVSVAADVSHLEGNTGDSTDFVFAVQLSSSSTSPVVVLAETQPTTNASGNAVDGSDYTGVTQTLTFAPGTTTQNVTVSVIGNNTVQPNRTFLLKIANPLNATVGTDTRTGTIIDDDGVVTPSMSIGNTTVTSGIAGGVVNAVFPVTLSAAATQQVTVQFATGDNTAVAGSDFTSTTGTLTFTVGQTTANITVPVLGSNAFELQEAFTVTLTNPVNATISNTLGTGTINSSATAPTLSIASNSVVEGNSGITNLVFTVTQSAVSDVGTTFVAATSNGGNSDATLNATAGSDYTATSATLTIPAGQTTATFTVPVIGDTSYERNEQFNVTLSGPTNATLGSPAVGTGTITNDDPAPVISVASPAAVNEGNSGTTPIVFSVTRTGSSNLPSTVVFTTQDGTATVADSDYQATSGTLTFTVGQTSATVTVLVNGDTIFENNETFGLVLSGPVDATLGTATATGTINNDDAAPVLSIANNQIAEGNSGTTDLVFTVTKTGATALSSTVAFATADGTATLANNDYQATSGTLTFAAGETSKTITVKIVGDTTVEANETFTVNLTNATGATVSQATATGTIVNDDAQPVFSVSGPAATAEGNSGTTNFVFTVNATGLTGGVFTVVVNTADGTNSDPATTANGDYVAITNQTLTFDSAGGASQSQTVTVSVNGDTTYEHNEQFSLNLSSPSAGSQIGTPTATATILNDDTKPTATISAVSPVAEPGIGLTTQATFNVTLSAASGVPTVLVLTPSAGGSNPAVAGTNFDATPQTITIAAGATSGTFNVTVTGDGVHTQDLTFLGTLSSPGADVTIGATAGSMTITDNEAPPTYGFSVSDQTLSVAEGNADHTITITLQMTGRHRNSITIPIIAPTGGTAVVNTDFNLVTSSVTFADNSASNTSATQTGTISITIHGNTTPTTNRSFIVKADTSASAATPPISTPITGAIVSNITITEDDLRTAVVSDVARVEGNSGTTNFVFTVSLNATSASQVLVAYHTADGNNASANLNATTADNDYVATSGTLTFTAGATSQLVTVLVNGDTKAEDNEQFRVVLDSISGDSAFQLIGTPFGTGTIQDDDGGISVADVAQAEGNSGFSNFVFTVSNNQTNTQAVSVVVTTVATTNADASINATPGVDYISTTQTLTFAAGGPSTQLFTVQVKGDTTKEADQTFKVQLSNLSGQTTPGISLTHGSAIGTILNDDAAVQTVSVSGKVFVDADGNGAQNGTEMGISGVAVHLSGKTDEGATVAGKLVYTDTTGAYSFLNLAPGTYSVTEDKPVLYGAATTHIGSAESLLLTSTSGYGTTLHGDTGNSAGGSFSHAVSTVANPNIFSRRGYLTTTGTTPTVIQSGTSMVIQGTSGNDTFTFTAGSTTSTVTLNGNSYTIDPAKVHDIIFDGFGGDDVATLTGGTGVDTADLTIGSGTLTGTNYKVTVSNVKTLTMNGGTGDVATIHDTALSDLLDAQGASATLTNGSGKSTVVNGFATVNANSANGGTDAINLGTIAYILNRTGNW